MRDNDRYCRRCGTPQPAAAPPSGALDISPRGISILCYIPWLGWIACAWVLLAGERFRASSQVRFHAFQGLYLFVAWMLTHWVLRQWFGLFDLRFLPNLLELALLGVWVFMLVKTSAGERYRLPLVGELAERSL